MSFKIKFWGVRGSIACPTAQHIGFGGNTSCVEVSLGGQRVILDAGTGLHELGHWFLRKDLKHATMLLSLTHWDHINGFPFFAPSFRADRSFVLMAGHLHDHGSVEKVLANQMSSPIFPVPLEKMGSKMEFADFKPGDTFGLGEGITVKTPALNHPGGATGYRIEFRGKAMCYVTDLEHVIGAPDETVLGLIEGADFVIYDSTYTDDEFPGRMGWGHSTWQEGVRLCQAAGAKTLAIFHHDPDHEDPFMEELESEASRMWSGAVVAREHMRFNLL